MSGLNNLETRLIKRGGLTTTERMNKDKEKSLRAALDSSYQNVTILLGNGKEFKALINPDKLSGDYDNKILSVPYMSKCLRPERSADPLNPEGYEPVNLHNGDVFIWKETKTRWLVFLEYIEEDAYFRA